MRHLAHCLILLMAPLAVHASDALSGSPRGACTYAPAESERGTDAPATGSNSANPAAAAPGKPATSHNGGDDDLLPRLRTPKWHRFLPGMFR
ncbi:hypothetical protein OK348_16685 [Flavobacterium sp. MXW15]|uniref:Secreted protein n=1 Tax=Xanthomonas chitinilytica TaxID=2989819 RepID=A0ABT3K058_9XANT|nr:hypothetical protein [Xanthomonas sp. H13-6]MCW4456418.1 hypothetical protein [Flavobacterium sp. MXW15]MCW4474123.1 hypothetical protein [Xanthomonas sp. H13-6]